MKNEGRGNPHQSPAATASPRAHRTRRVPSRAPIPRGSQRTKRRICAAAGVLCLLLMLGVIGGMDAGSIRFGAGAAWAIGLEAVGVAALWKAGVLTWRR